MQTDVPSTTDNATVAEWKRLLEKPEAVEAIRDGIETASANVERKLLDSPALLLPRSAEERQNGFENWLARHHDQLTQSLSGELTRSLREIALSLNRPDIIADDLVAAVWPMAEPEMRARAQRFLVVYAIRGLALNWLVRHIGEGLAVGGADHLGKFWRVSLQDRRSKQPVAVLALDEDGNVLTSVSALREMISGRR